MLIFGIEPVTVDAAVEPFDAARREPGMALSTLEFDVRIGPILPVGVRRSEMAEKTRHCRTCGQDGKY